MNLNNRYARYSFRQENYFKKTILSIICIINRISCSVTSQYFHYVNNAPHLYAFNETLDFIFI